MATLPFKKKPSISTQYILTPVNTTVIILVTFSRTIEKLSTFCT